MYDISQPARISLEAHINYLEYLYTECYKDHIEPDTLKDILHQIKELKKKLNRIKNVAEKK